MLLLDAAPEFAAAPALQRLPARALRRYVFRATIPALLLAAAAALIYLLALDSLLGGLPALLLIPLAAFYGWLRYRAAGWAFEEGRLITRFRRLARSTAIAPRRRLQSRDVIRSPFQRRARLATFRARVASGGGGGALQIADLDSGAAETLADGLGPRPYCKGR